MSRASRHMFRAVMADSPDRLDLACLLIAAEALPTEGNVDSYLARGVAALDRLAECVPDEGDPHERLAAVLGDFGGVARDYEALASSLLPEVLRRRRGLPILLSTVWTEVARRVGIAAYGVGLPGHFVVAIGDPATFHPDLPDGSRLLVDPWSGGRLLRFDAARDLVERTGQPFRRDHLAPAQPVNTVERILANVRAWADHPLRAVTRLWAIDLALALPEPPPWLLRDRGLALRDLGHLPLSARWLEEYAEVVEDTSPREADTARREARGVRARLN
ncbi:MAG: transglutaminase family protein [Actinomycetota bacterium]